MLYFKINNVEEVLIYYQDMGYGKLVIFIYGWLFNSCMWEYQMGELLKYFCCIVYDCCGFGKFDKLWGGYDYNMLVEDLFQFIEYLELMDVILVGFFMGGGEVVCYFINYGSEKIFCIVFVVVVMLFML